MTTFLLISLIQLILKTTTHQPLLLLILMTDPQIIQRELRPLKPIRSRVKLYIPTLREPIDYNDIFNLEDKELWLEAVHNELKGLKLMNVYNAIDKVPPNANVISCQWVFKYKRDSKGNIIKRKARLVARGFTQQIGIDFQETFSPRLNTTLSESLL